MYSGAAAFPSGGRGAFRGIASSVATLERTGVAQHIMAIVVSNGGPDVIIKRITVDVAKASASTTVPPSIIRICRSIADGVSQSVSLIATKTPKDSRLNSDNNVTVLVEGATDWSTTGRQIISITNLQTTADLVNNCLSQEYSTRMFTAIGPEVLDQSILLEDKGIVLHAGQALSVTIDNLSLGAPTNSSYAATIEWYEIKP